ncbi:MAG: hypothetical protein A2Y03_09530 [Omnitrophica WOR_2 bacterium GWF2_38_59]|nr:MAG: hypothetical protein A2Y03_09530 [Omnitrophica WOR_2 bacterium GWF2_38_59]OGX49599.1 MAG: hypothetical protein A2243_11735 [Omnitrophica WOR_2 bacterium RIFOXYA2_FULL_38_17]OGX52645.1 MAG: hypothetical protein A2267_10485 [Omnitrophica WOR_2 bacterium RIFOXYA12_FULL_38_10]OGX58881.1 MAG: hypothetical protein A2306_10835 [Omnitrophica WOR_2 bacterium RIFOXYB2_FULL_38_16]OGX59454.1 MAG: hypothetical protein A2447_06195 [Omnitrophica WOR_2 bacterium RIFOXYC2_FULL_38_12]HBG61637.1 hypothet
MIEHAIYISSINDLKLLTHKYKRIYFGAEFCSNLLPSIKDIKDVLNICNDKKLVFTLVLPWCHENNIDPVKRILKFLPPKTEVVYNDWGIWKIMEEDFKHKAFKYVLGRILSDTKNDPRALQLSDKKSIDFSKQCALNNDYFQKSIIEKGINQAELSNTFQGYNFSLQNNISTTIYYPYVFSSVTTFCLFKKDITIEYCGQTCINKYILCKLPKKELKTPMFIRGNYEFYKNSNLPSATNLSKWNTNRIVFMPKLTY